MKISIIYTTVLIAATLHFVNSVSVNIDTDDAQAADAHIDNIDKKVRLH